MTYFLSFVREFGTNPDYADYAFGRVEVYSNDENSNGYADEEIRFLTSRTDEFEKFRDRWDFLNVTAEELELVRKTIAERFVEGPK